MSSAGKKFLIAVILVAVVVAVILFLTAQTPNSEVITSSDSVSASLKNEKVDISKPSNATSTIAEQWQWQQDKELEASQELDNGDTVSLLFTPQSVHNALQAVKVDNNGDVILDYDALISLDEALERIYKRLDGESLNSLQDLIKDALPGKVGQQTAKLVGDYHQFLKAKEEFSQIHEGTGSLNDVQTVATVQSDQALYSELQALRELHLGDDVAESLFHVPDANAEFMFESMKIGLDDTLTLEQKTQRQQEIQAKLTEQVGSN